VKFKVDPTIYNNVREQLDRIAKGWQTYLHCGDDDASAVKLAIKIQGWKRGLFIAETFYQQGRYAFLIGVAPVAKKSGTHRSEVHQSPTHGPKHIATSRPLTCERWRREGRT